MLCVLSDCLTVVEERKVTLLGLLDMSAAFNCVYHEIHLRRLAGDVINWISLFITGTQQVVYNIRTALVRVIHRGTGIYSGTARHEAATIRRRLSDLY